MHVALFMVMFMSSVCVCTMYVHCERQESKARVWLWRFDLAEKKVAARELQTNK